MSGPGSYRQWPKAPQLRWARAANAFGQHLMSEWTAVLEQMPPSASTEAKELARQTGVSLLHGIMAILDGIVAQRTDDGYTIEYALQARIRETLPSGERATCETFELAPGGEGLHHVLGAWLQGDFTLGTEPPPRQPGPVESREQQEKVRKERADKKRQDIERRAAAGPPCPRCGKPLRTALAKQCFACGHSWRE